MSEIVELRDGGIEIRDHEEKQKIEKVITEALLVIAREHVRMIAESTDDLGTGFDREHCGLRSLTWLQHTHRENYPDLYLQMNGAIRGALRLPQRECLVAHAYLNDDWAQYGHLRTAIKKSIWHCGLHNTVVAVHLPSIELGWRTFYGAAVSELRSRRDALTGELNRILMFEAANRGV